MIQNNTHSPAYQQQQPKHNNANCFVAFHMPNKRSFLHVICYQPTPFAPQLPVTTCPKDIDQALSLQPSRKEPHAALMNDTMSCCCSSLIHELAHSRRTSASTQQGTKVQTVHQVVDTGSPSLHSSLLEGILTTCQQLRWLSSPQVVREGFVSRAVGLLIPGINRRIT